MKLIKKIMNKIMSFKKELKLKATERAMNNPKTKID